MDESLNQNWYSSEAFKHEREKAEQVLEQMKELEERYKKTREKIVEKTLCGERIIYLKNEEL